MRLIAVLTLLASASAATAQGDSHAPVFDRMADTLVAAASRADDPVPDRWYAVGIRARHARWHLAEPDDGDGWYRRTGWISESGYQIGLAACGPEAGVAAFGFQLRGESIEPLLDALAAAGTLTEEEGPGDPVWRFEAEGRVPARISFSVVCTPEGSAAARTCQSHAVAAYAGDPREMSCTAP